MINKSYYHFKVIVIGDSGVGKTSILNKFCSNKTFLDYLQNGNVNYIFEIL